MFDCVEDAVPGACFPYQRAQLPIQLLANVHPGSQQKMAATHLGEPD